MRHAGQDGVANIYTVFLFCSSSTLFVCTCVILLYRFLELGKGVPQKGGPQGGQLVQGAAESPQIAAGVIRAVGPNFRAHVVRGANLGGRWWIDGTGCTKM